MNDYIDLVLAKYAPNGSAEYLFYAPFNSGVTTGDMITVEKATDDPAIAIATNVFSCRKDSEEYSFILKVAGKQKIRRVAGVIKPLDYSDEDYFTGME
jgi:hypothetical protein